MLKWAAVAAVLLMAALVVRAGAGDTWRKIIFYGGAIGIALLKVFGLITTAISWPYIIILGIVGVITEPEATAIDDLRALPLRNA